MLIDERQGDSEQSLNVLQSTLLLLYVVNAF